MQFQAAILEDDKNDAEFDLDETIKLSIVLNHISTQKKTSFLQYTKEILNLVEIIFINYFFQNENLKMGYKQKF